jgi:hypothetical protein
MSDWQCAKAGKFSAFVLQLDLVAPNVYDLLAQNRAVLNERPRIAVHKLCLLDRGRQRHDAANLAR